MATFARAQFLYSTDGTDPATVSITPTAASSILVAEGNERSGGTEANHVVIDTLGIAWNKVVGHNQAFGDSNARQSVSLWWCPAGSTAARTVSFDDGTANGKRLSVSEYTTDEAGTWEFEAQVAVDSGTGSTPPLATGDTASVAAGENLVVAWVAWRTNAPQAGDVTIGTGYGAVGDTGAGSNGRQHATAWKKDTVGGTYSASVGWTGDGHEASAGVVVMQLVPSGPGPNPVATGPLTKTNDTYSGYRIGGFEATDDVAVTQWRHRIEGGAWTVHGVVTHIDITGRTHGDTETVDVEAGDADDNWSNTLTIEAHVGWRDESINALSFPANATGNSNISMLMGNPPPRGSCTIMWWERMLSQETYYGGMIFAPQTSTFDGGRYTALFVGHGASGAVDTTGQRTTGQTTPIYHEIAGLYDGGSSGDFIASPESIVGAGNQEAHLVPFSVWKRRAVEIESMNVGGVDVYRHTDYVDLDDPTKTIIQDWPQSRLDLQGDDPGLYYGTPPWITDANATENAYGQVSRIRVFDAPLGLTNIQLESVATTDAGVTSAGIAALHYSNLSPIITDITDKSGNSNDFVWQGSFRPTNYTESIEVEVDAPDGVEMAADGAAQASAAGALSVAKTLGAVGTSQAGATAALLNGVSLAAAGLAVASGGASMSHGVPLQASAAAIAVAGAQMALAVSLGGAGLAEAAAAAGLALDKPLAADGAATAAGAAALSTTGDAELGASGAAQAAGTALLSLTVGLSGAAVAQALASAALAAGKGLAAVATAQAGGTATLQAGNEADLAAAGTAQASAGASLQLEVPISAAALAQAVASGALLLTVPLGAAALAQASSSASFDSSVQMSAQGAALATASAALNVLPPMARAPRGSGYFVSAPHTHRPSTRNTRRP